MTPRRYCDACDLLAARTLDTTDGYRWQLCEQHHGAYLTLEAVGLIGDWLHERVREQRRPGRPPCDQCGGNK